MAWSPPAHNAGNVRVSAPGDYATFNSNHTPDGTIVLPKATEGRRNRIEARATAFSHRGALCEWGCLSSWLDPAADDVNVRRTRELAEVMRPFTTDSDYVNQIGLETDDGSESVKAAYGANY